LYHRCFYISRVDVFCNVSINISAKKIWHQKRSLLRLRLQWGTGGTNPIRGADTQLSDFHLSDRAMGNVMPGQWWMMHLGQRRGISGCRLHHIHCFSPSCASAPPFALVYTLVPHHYMKLGTSLCLLEAGRLVSQHDLHLWNTKIPLVWKETKGLFTCLLTLSVSDPGTACRPLKLFSYALIWGLPYFGREHIKLYGSRDVIERPRSIFQIFK
jgi:hypothetical protein